MNETTNEVHIKLDYNESLFSSSFSSTLRARAKELEISETDLRAENLKAMEFLKNDILPQNNSIWESLSELLFGVAKKAQLCGNIGKSIWETGEVPKGMWYVKGEGYDYYTTNNFLLYQLPAGISDGVIGEVAGIPLMIKMVGELVFDSEKRAAFTQMFSMEGLEALLSSLKDEYIDSWSDPDRQGYISGKVTIEVGSMFTGVGVLVKGSKVAKLVDNIDVSKVLKADILPFERLANATKKIESIDLQKALGTDLSTNPNLFDNFGGDIERGVDAWDAVSSYSAYRLKPNILKAADDLLSNPKLRDAGLSPDLVKRLVTGNHGAGAEFLEPLLKGYNALVDGGTKFKNVNRLLADLEKLDGTTNFASGARWVQRYMVKNPAEFKGKTISFEDIISGENARRVDVKVEKMADDPFPDLYEFKSVKDLPPAHFVEQFLKDLNSAKRIGQLKWIFDGEKLKKMGIDKLDKKVFLKALRDANKKNPINSDLIKKWVGEDAKLGDFLKFIDNNFDEIFIIGK